MKWRHSILYLLVLLSIGGYFYYFEVLKKEQRAAAEKEAKKIFNVRADQVRAVEIIPRDNETVRLKKETAWYLMNPIRSDVDEGALMGLLHTLESLEAERQIAAAPKDVSPFGLERPALKIRLHSEEQWKELLLGDKNPVGDGYYAQTDSNGGVFLIEAGNWGVLNKGVNELRRHELFTFEREEVTELQVVWSDHASVEVRKTEDGSEWTAQDNPGMAIRKSKVENVLDQLHWLRATKFLENETQNLAPYSLEPPYVRVNLRFKEGREATLRLGKQGEGEETLTAVSSQLPAVVQVSADLLEELPRNLKDLEDRSLLTLDTKAVKQLTWQMGDSRGQVVRMGDNKWGWKTGETPPQEFKESWRVGALLWELQAVDYDQKLEPMPTIPARPYVRLELEDERKKPETLSWNGPVKGPDEKSIVWIESEGRTQAVELKGEVVSKMESKLIEIGTPDEGR